MLSHTRSISSVDYASLAGKQVVLVHHHVYPFLQEDVKTLKILGSSNGLICLGISDSKNVSNLRRIYIWNPSTNEYKQISCSTFDDRDYCFRAKYGFGYDNSIDDYKVVRILGRDSCEYHECLDIQVYTLGSDPWHRVQTVPYSFACEKRFSSLLFNGALHWLAYNVASQGQGKSWEVIVAFEISKERHLHLLLPKETIKGWREVGNDKKRLGVLGDCICLSISFLVHGRTDIWIMQDYGVQDSWTKQFTITQLQMHKYFSCKPIWTFENGEILLETVKDLIVYDPKSGNIRTAMRDTDLSVNRECYVGSLISVKSGTYVEKTDFFIV
ncbi:F-box/kelch-repeat protein At3g06240-like [Papaver somniferum]|uniref:F-box/kelch-repeat protein At3g06240-like n=1 Tax=Papaver somniferum TaxID=3469 RepID=UPI000E6F9317|nr:F-box/kelch-repeat protein At3g06240-like [Papaver somniferum]